MTFFSLSATFFSLLATFFGPFWTRFFTKVPTVTIDAIDDPIAAKVLWPECAFSALEDTKWRPEGYWTQFEFRGLFFVVLVSALALFVLKVF
jgi:hypothetical protein